MQTHNYQPRAEHKRFHDWVRAWSPMCENACGSPAMELHHILGAAAKHNKVWIGQWAVCMLCYACNHSNDRLPIKKEQLQRFWLDGVLKRYRALEGKDPCPAEVIQAIEEWQR